MAAQENYESLRADLEELTTDFNQFKDTKQQQHSAMQSEVNNLRFSNLQAHSDIINQINILKTRIDSINPEDGEEIDYSAIRSQLEYLNNELNILKNRVDNIINPGSDDEEPQDYSGLISALNELETSFNLLTADYEQFKIAKQQQNSALQTEINNMRFNNTQEHESIITQINIIKERLNNLDPSGEDDGEGSSSQEQQSLQEQLAILQAALETLDTDYRENKTTRQQQISLMQAEINNLRFSNTQQFQNMQTEIDDFRNTQTQQAENLISEFNELKITNNQNFSAIITDLHTLQEQSVRFDALQAKTTEEKAIARRNIGAVELDDTLSVTGRAADSAVVGQEIAELEKSLNLKADRFLVGEDGLLYVYAGDEQIAALGPFAGGGGSGGGEGGGSQPTNNAIINARNTTGWITNTISAGGQCQISFEWESTENDIPTGEGSLTVYVNGVRKINRGISQGSVTSNIKSFLSSGRNTVRAEISDIYNNKFYINWTVIVVALSMRSNFDPTAVYKGAITFPYVASGQVEKTIYVSVDGTVIDTAITPYSDRQMTMILPAQSHGTHVIKAWCEAVINDTLVYSNYLTYQIICLENNDNEPIISSSTLNEDEISIDQYSNIVIEYQVYSPQSLTSNIVLKVNDEPINNLTVDRTKQLWAYRATESGDLKLSITCGNTVKEWNINVIPSSADIGAIEQGLQLYLSARNRSNGESHPELWSYKNISANLTGFNFINNGWLVDNEGGTFLRVSNGATVTIPFEIFKTDFGNSGKTITFEFAARYIKDYNSVILSCIDGGRGLKITPNYISFTSEQVTVTADYKDEQHVSITFAVENNGSNGKDGNRLIFIYINGIPSGVIQYPASDDFAQIHPTGITIGSNQGTIDVYNIRVYNTYLSGAQILRNWIADTEDVTEMLDRYDRNNIYNAAGKIDFTKLKSNLPYAIFEAVRLPQVKGDKLPVSGEFVDRQDPTKSFTYEGGEMDAQGTTSSKYAVKNIDLKLKEGVQLRTGHSDNYTISNDVIPFNRFVFKADMASSEGANNVKLVDLYNKLNPVKRREQLDDPRIRWGIYGRPIVGFYRDPDTKEITFIGKYNFNLPKRAPGPYGYSGNMESWEFELNATNLMAFKTDVFDMTMKLDPQTGEMKQSWRFDYEARFPNDTWVNINKLQEFQSFVYSTYREEATNNPLPQSITYDNVLYTNDTADYRLAKFRNEFGNYAEIDSFVFYYIFTEFFLLADSREKNLFIGFSGSDTDTEKVQFIDRKAVAEPYDMDTALGTNNEGTLTFKYSLEDIDVQPDGRGIFTGQDSVLWKNVRDAFQTRIIQMYGNLRSNGLNYDSVIKLFEDHQAVYPEAVWIEDAWYKYIRTYINPLQGDESTGLYLAMLQGSKEMQRKFWLSRRFSYMDSKWNRGDAFRKVIQFRAYNVADLTVTPYIDLYPTVQYASYTVSKRSTEGTPTVLECPMDKMDDTEVYIYSADQLSSLGDLSGFRLGIIDISSAVRLLNLKIGKEDANYENVNMVDLRLGNNILLEQIDCRNCKNLGGIAVINNTPLVSTTPTIEAQGCTGLKRAYFDNTSIKGLALADGAPLNVIHLPSTITNLTLRNLKELEEFVCPSYSNVTTLWIENCSDVIDPLAILDSIQSNSRVRIIGFDINANSYQDIVDFYNELDTMRGLDENGNTVEIADGGAQVSGTIHINSLTGAQLAELQARYPYITIDAAHTTSYRYFKSYDGSSNIGTVECQDGIAQSAAPTVPARSDSEDGHYSYAPLGWSTNTDSQTANYDHNSNTLADVTYYAAYTWNVKTYIVTWNNSNNTTLQTDNNVPWGTIPTYNGSTPVDPSGNNSPFVSWNPVVGSITGNTTYTANFKPVYTVKFYNQAGTNVLQTKNVIQGNTVTYTGQVPTNEDNTEFLGWSTSANATETNAILTNITENKNFYAVHKPLFTELDLLCMALDDGTYTTKYNVNDTIPIDLDGATYTGKILAIDTDVDANDDPIPVTIGFDELLPTKMQMNTTNTNASGWEASAGRTTVAGYESKLPESVQLRLVAAKKYSIIQGGSEQVTYDKLWIPNYKELGFTSNQETSGPVYSGVYTDNNSRIKKLNGTANYYWTRTASSSVTNIFRRVDTSGEARSSAAGDSNGVALGFCLGSKKSAEKIAWDNLHKSIYNGTVTTDYSLGDTIPYTTTDDDTYHAQIVGFGKDVDSSDQSIPVTFITQELWKTQYKMNSTNTNSGGWNASVMRTSTMPALKAKLPEYVTKRIVAAKKYSTIYSASGQTTVDEVWIPNYKELGFTSSQESGGASYSEVFNGNAAKIKKLNGTANYYWTRTAYASNSNLFRVVDASGEANSGYASTSYGVALGFCFGDTRSEEEKQWDNLHKSIQNGTVTTDYSLGDTIPYTTTDGDTYHAQIVGFGKDVDANGNTIPVSFITQELWKTKYMMGDTVSGWKTSLMRTSTMPALKAKLPNYVTKHIISAKKISYNKNINNNQNTLDDVWIPSTYELFDGATAENDGINYKEIFTNDSARIKTFDGQATYYWLRTVNTFSNTMYLCVTGNGSSNSFGPTNAYGVALGFCIG